MLGEFERKDFRNKVILESMPSFPFAGHNQVPNKNIKTSIEMLSYEKNTIKFKTSSNSKGFVVIADAFHPGWEATVNEESRSLLRANYIMRAIPISPGTNQIVLKFRPMMVLSGLTITAISWAVIIALILAWLLRYVFHNCLNGSMTDTKA